jgi:hypothetical protein
MQFGQLKRREFITLIVGVMLPRVAGMQKTWLPTRRT